MNLGLSDKDIAFREEVRAFLRDNLTPELAAAGKKATSVFVEPEYTLAWQKKLHAKGWAAPSWPEAYGGPGWTEMQRYIFASECAIAGAPPLAPMGLNMVGPCIIGYGTPEQKAFFLPRLLAGTTIGAKGILNRNQGPIWRLFLSRRNEMTTITSSMDRRSGRRMPTMQTACSVSCEPTTQASPSKASPSSFSRCRHPVSPSIRSSHWRANMN